MLIALSKFRVIAPWLAAIVSGILLAISFPPVEQPDAAWFCVVPLLIACGFASPKRGFQLGFVSGAVWWLGSIFWLTHVTFVGWFFLSLYCGLFTGLVGWLVAKWFRRFGHSSVGANLGLMLLVPLIWTGGEYFRCTFCSGFPWNPLGVALYRNLALIQLAAFGGAYLVSAVVVWMNIALATALLGYFARKGVFYRRTVPELLIGLVVLALCYTAGIRISREIPDGTRKLRIALIQPNVLQDEKWDQAKIKSIYEDLTDLMAKVRYCGDLDLVVFPETVVPDDLRYSEPSYKLIHDFATNGTPLFVGSMDAVYDESGHPKYLNSSMLIDTRGRLVEQYDKRHLVPFGEYVPLQNILPFIKALTPIEASFSPGSTSTVFHLDGPDTAFSALICFEDSIAQLSRESVRNGARLLINQTNDAWFDPSGCSRQHMAQCVFRCVENHVPAVRSANTGVSCHIDARGNIFPSHADVTDAIRTTGFLTPVVTMAPPDLPMTFYTRHGDLFGVAALVVTLFASLIAAMRREHKPLSA